MKACTAKLSCEICKILIYHAEQSASSLPMFRDNLLIPFPKVKKSVRENTVQMKLYETIFFLGALSIIYFFKEARCFRSQICFHFQTKKHLTWWTTSNELLSITGNQRNITLLRYIPENRSSPRIVTGIWLLQKN